MKFGDSLLDDIRVRLPVSQVVGKKVPLKRAGREYKGLSPFKDEKTPSFTVNDQKGFYHCFATGEHGDIFTFLMKTEGLSFPEAVQELAQQAGVEMPKMTARSQEQEDARDRLYRLMEDAAAFFEEQLVAQCGGHARSYLDQRGLAHDTQRRFRMGYAPNDRSAMKQFLAGRGYRDDEMITSGMLIGGDDIAVSYDRFRDRIMFPIEDLSGRVIAFGGRALSADVPAKYLNSPETPLFHKGSVLYNAKRARSSAYDAGMVIAVEGYMDVIALSAAGFDNAVAPLGTALTENQISLLWRMHPEPVLCFDGDVAGKKAAFRSVDTVMPNLAPGYSLRFAFMPDGMDPDDLIKAEGADAMRKVLGAAQTLTDVFWTREWELGTWDTPERRAMLEKQIRNHTQQIKDESVRYHYDTDMRQRLRDAWRPQFGNKTGAEAGGQYVRGARSGGSGGGGGGWKKGGPKNDGIRGRFAGYATGSLRQSSLVSDDKSNIPLREAVIALTLLNHPWMLEENAEEISDMSFRSDVISTLRDNMLEAAALDLGVDMETLHTHLSSTGHSKVLELIAQSVPEVGDAFCRPDAQKPDVRLGWRHTLALHKKLLGLKQELDIAEKNFASEFSDSALARVVELTKQLNDAEGREAVISGYGTN